MRTLPMLAVLALLAPASLQAQEHFSWRGRLAQGQTIEIRGVNGWIHAEPASGDEVEVTADKHGRRSDPADVQIKVVPHSGGVTICAIYPTPSGRPANECVAGGGHSSTRDNDVHVDFTVHVPAGVVLDAHTVNGDVEAKGLRGDVDASTVNGSIEASTAGIARAKTVNGSIDVSMGRADWTGDLELETVNGAITASFPASLQADVEAGTVNGGISTDFPLTVQGRFGPKKLHGTIGNGGRSLVLKTVNGGIELRKQ